MFKIICQDCKGIFDYPTQFKKLCPTCAINHRRATQRKYNHSEKGYATYRKAHPMGRPRIKTIRYCRICHAIICDRSKGLCAQCYFDTLRSKTGGHATNWKGGRFKQNRSGYIMVYCPNHPKLQNKTRAKERYIGEHRLVWEQAHGKLLPDGWVVHHLNGQRADNRISNLVGMPRKRHDGLRKAMEKRIQELEGLLQNQGLLF